MNEWIRLYICEHEHTNLKPWSFDFTVPLVATVQPHNLQVEAHSPRVNACVLTVSYWTQGLSWIREWGMEKQALDQKAQLLYFQSLGS